MSPSSYDAACANNLARAIWNLTNIMVALTEIVAGTSPGVAPTQAQIASVVTLAGTAGVISPKPTYSVDGESWDWVGYQTFIASQIIALRKAQVIFMGPFEVQSRACF